MKDHSPAKKPPKKGADSKPLKAKKPASSKRAVESVDPERAPIVVGAKTPPTKPKPNMAKQPVAAAKHLTSDVPASDTPPYRLPSSGRPITVRGVRVHNLKNISLELPRNKLIVFTGVSGSGKSSLAFDTLYAEGQRRYVESLSVYARQFLERMEKPDVDAVLGISPAVAIEQKTLTRNPRSTVATTTEIYDYLRLLFARVGQTFCSHCGTVVRKDTPRSIIEEMKSWRDEERFYVLFPMHLHEHHSLSEEWQNLRKQGFFRIVLNGEQRILDLSEDDPKQIKPEDVRILVDRLIWRSDDEAIQSRIADSIETAFREGGGRVIIARIEGDRHTVEMRYSEKFECAACGIEYDEPEPKLFSFNNPFGACPECQGFGRAVGIDMDLVVPDKTLSIKEGAIVCWNSPKFSSNLQDLLTIADEAGIDVKAPYFSLSAAEHEIIRSGYKRKFKGIRKFFREIEEAAYKLHYRVLLSRYRGHTTCPKCEGSRLRQSAMNVKIAGKTIFDVVRLTIREARSFFDSLSLTEYHLAVGVRILEELRKRLGYLDDVGLHYLTLDRVSNTLSGGESQRINLSSSLGSALVGALYVLDEPSIGLHPRDTDKLMNIIRRVRNLGNSVVLVEHDEEVIRSADQIIDFGPLAGEEGGEIMFQGTLRELVQDLESPSFTGKYLRGELTIPVPKRRRTVSKKNALRIVGASENNLKAVSVDVPLGVFVAVTGVSGSGKSSLVHSVLYNGIQKLRGESVGPVGIFKNIENRNLIDSVILVDQSPIGRSPRSNPATYLGIFDIIRDAFSKTVYAKQNGWTPGHFSFNIPGGRCETCTGEGFVKVEMQFLADMYLLCETCNGKRYKAEVLQAKINGKNIVDVLAMTVTEAREFFQDIDRIASRFKVLEDVGMGYIRVGQPATTLSGGEAQRIKLASFLVQAGNDHTLFIFDEPTTGLHFHDIAKLLKALNALVDAGNTVLTIEHNLEVIKTADWIIDIGPEAGSEGGMIVAEGTPETVAKNPESHTGRYLAPLLAKA